jgi:Outer membrane protein beta-barrel domain
MQRWFPGSVLVVMIALGTASTAAAQARTPDKGMFAITLSGGLAFPADEAIENGLFMGVSAEGYVTPRFSIRAQFGGAWHDANTGDLKVSPMHITGNAVYNWEHGKWHPYASGGIGWYNFRFGEGDDRPSDSAVGINLGGGIEYFFTRRDTITGDLTIHFVSGEVTSPFFVYEPRYWTLAGGYKHYF